MVALDTTLAKPAGNHLVDEIRKALGGTTQQLLSTLSSLHAWADEVLTAVIDCVEQPVESEEKKKKEVKAGGTLTLEHLLNERVKKFLTEHVAQLGAEGAIRLVAELEKRIGDETKDEKKTRIYAHLLAHLVAGGANVLGLEKLRGVVREALAAATIALWRRGIHDASYSLARVLVYILLAERDYLEGVKTGMAAEWWKERVIAAEKKLKKNAFFAALSTLVEHERSEKKDWRKVDFASIDADISSIVGPEGVLTARWILVDTVVTHASSLAARCSTTVYEQLVGVAVKAHVERGELTLLVSRLAGAADLPRATWALLARAAVYSIQRTLDSCTEGRERLVIEGSRVSIAEDTSNQKHRVGCGCSVRVGEIVAGLATAPRTSIDTETMRLIESSLILVLSAFDTSVEEPLRAGVELLGWLIENEKRFDRSWPAAGAQLLRGIKWLLIKERTGETYSALLSLSSAILSAYGHSLQYPSRLFADVGHVASRVLIGEDTSAIAVAAMKPTGPAKSIDRLATSLLKWAHAVRCDEERGEDEAELLSEWSTTLLTTTAAHGLSAVVLGTLVSMGREQREALLPRVWSEKKAAEKMISDCLSLLLDSAAPDETFERNATEHFTAIVAARAATINGGLARAACLFLLNCTPYLATKISPADLATWPRLRAMDAHCARLVLERTKPEAIQSLFAQLPAEIGAFTPKIAAFIPEQADPEPEEEKEVEEEEEKGGKKGKKKKQLKKDPRKPAEAVKRKRVEKVVDPASTAALVQLARLTRLAAVALSERAAVQPEVAAAALAAAAGCLAAAAPCSNRPAAESAAAAFYEMATRCLEVFGEPSAHCGLLSIALATAATRQPPSTDYERSRAELLQHARLLAAAARHCKQGLLRDQVCIYSQLLARLLQSAAAHAERLQGLHVKEDASWVPSAGACLAKRRRREEQRTLHAAAKAANAINEEAHFAKVMPFVLSECLLPLRTAPPAVQYPAVLLSHAIDRYGRSFLATCLPPSERLAYTRMFPTFKEMNRRVV